MEREEKCSLLNNREMPLQALRRRSYLPSLCLVFNLLLFCSSAIMLLRATTHWHEPSLKRPARFSLDKIARYHSEQLQGDFEHRSVFKGEPRPELDDAWNRITNGGVFSVGEETLQLLNVTSENSVRLPAVQGGGYIASLEMFHQLHCLVSTSRARTYHFSLQRNRI